MTARRSDSGNHPMEQRILWTWDSWVCDPFNAESYVTEYSRLIDFMAEWGYNGLIIWGFIDERHGGEESARAVASYGKAKGVRVMPGMGAGGYGGFTTSRGHRFSVETLVREHPELAAVRRDPPSWGQVWICLYQEKTLEWLREGAAWLADNFEIGGVNIETNEAGTIDVCEHASQASSLEPNRLRYSASFYDLSVAVPIIHQEVKQRIPDAWVSYATYQPPWWERREDAWLLDRMPDDAIAQWNIEMSVNVDVPPPVKRNISLIHSGGWSYHLAAWPPIRQFTQRRCFYPDLEQARQFARNQRAMCVDGFALGNVGSHLMPDNEIAYIAHIEFARNPEMTMEEFSDTFVSRLYGERAAPLVKELMLSQPELHRALVKVRDGLTRVMLGLPLREFAPVEDADLEMLSRQISLAERAWGVASGDGRRRLEVIRAILGEERVLAELSRIPTLSREARDWFEQRRWSSHGDW